MNIKIKIFAKFPCQLIEMKIRPIRATYRSKSSSYYTFQNGDKLYMTDYGDLFFTTEKLDRNKVIVLNNLKQIPYEIKDIRYRRTSNDYKNKLFIHHFNGSEKIYFCYYKNKLVYFMKGNKPLYKVEYEER